MVWKLLWFLRPASLGWRERGLNPGCRSSLPSCSCSAHSEGLCGEQLVNLLQCLLPPALPCTLRRWLPLHQDTALKEPPDDSEALPAPQGQLPTSRPGSEAPSPPSQPILFEQQQPRASSSRGVQARPGVSPSALFPSHTQFCRRNSRQSLFLLKSVKSGTRGQTRALGLQLSLSPASLGETHTLPLGSKQSTASRNLLKSITDLWSHHHKGAFCSAEMD